MQVFFIKNQHFSAEIWLLLGRINRFFEKK